MSAMSRQCVAARTLVLVWTLQSLLTPATGQASRPGSSGVDMSQLMTDFEEGNGAGNNNHPFYSLTPSTPPPGDIDCVIEVLTVTPVGGRCVPLGRRFAGRRRRGNNGGDSSGNRRRSITWGCQSGVHLSLSQDCQNRRTRSRRGRN